MTLRQACQIALDAAPTCSVYDAQPDRYRVWLDKPLRVVQAQSKKELVAKLRRESWESACAGGAR